MALQWSSIITEGKNGKVSAIRIGFLVTLAVVLLNWSFINYNKKTEMVALPDNAVALIVGLAGAKVVQRFSEAKQTLEKPKVDNTASV